MDIDEIKAAFKPGEKIIIVGVIDIGSPVHHIICALIKDNYPVVVVQNEKEARKEMGINEAFVRPAIPIVPLPELPKVEFFPEENKGPIGAIAKGHKPYNKFKGKRR